MPCVLLLPFGMVMSFVMVIEKKVAGWMQC
jgi:hypothetical protein